MIRAVTLDFYGTLVDHGTCEQVYALDVGEAVPVAMFRRRFDQEMTATFDWLVDRRLAEVDEFPSLRVMYRNVYRKLFAEFALPGDVELSTERLMAHVARPTLFPETLTALARLRKTLCLVPGNRRR